LGRVACGLERAKFSEKWKAVVRKIANPMRAGGGGVKGALVEAASQVPGVS